MAKPSVYISAKKVVRKLPTAWKAVLSEAFVTGGKALGIYKPSRLSGRQYFVFIPNKKNHSYHNHQ